MLEPNKEILIAKIIGLLNGLDGEGVSFKEENMLRSALDAIKNNRDLTKYITFFDEKRILTKLSYLSKSMWKK